MNIDRTVTIMYDGQEITPGMSFEYPPGACDAVTYVGIRQTPDGEELVLEDRLGQFGCPVGPGPGRIIVRKDHP